MANQNNSGKETRSKTIKALLEQGASEQQIAEQVGCAVSYVKLVVKRLNEKGEGNGTQKEQKEKAKAALLDFVSKTTDLPSLKSLAHDLISNTKDQALLVKIHSVNVL